MIRGIIFDCFGVLYQGSLGHLRDYTAAEDLPELANLNLSSDYGYVSREEYIEQVGRLTHKSPIEIEAVMRASHIRNQALISIVRTLRSKYKVAMLSNVGRDLMDQLFTKAELAELFDVIVLSSDVGMVKPDPEIFRYICSQMDLAPEECVMVDDIEANIEAAKSLGMHGIVFNTTSNFISDSRQLIAYGNNV
ncbi:MAG: putative (S)-2-haloacid dehalogenase [Candidatus Saccharibacteria bacterium]|jgi:epoxide hydrolase-like predicted phosphatase|nr:putative (S)-2-haloacid dehalogenase [Candidatus Saccharibacteria bacterium]